MSDGEADNGHPDAIYCAQTRQQDLQTPNSSDSNHKDRKVRPCQGDNDLGMGNGCGIADIATPVDIADTTPTTWMNTQVAPMRSSLCWRTQASSACIAPLAFP